MKKSYYIAALSLFILYLQVNAGPVISFFFKPAPDIEKISQKLKQPGKLAQYTIKGAANPHLIEGINVFYGGYVTMSDYNGEVILPRKHTKTAVDILITPEVIPVPLFENTILHWKRLPHHSAVMYSCQEMYDDKKNDYYWQTTQVPLSDDMTIPLAAIIIVAKPKDIEMNTEKVITHASANMVLPDMYVAKGINSVENSVYTLTIRHFFKPIVMKEHREPLEILTHIID